MVVAHGIPVKGGTVNVSVILRVIDSTDGTPEAGVDHATAGIDLKYWREGATATDITEAAVATLDAAHTDGGVEQIGTGYIRVDLPDAAVATGVQAVHVFGTATGMVVVGATIPIVAYDPQDTVRLGLTALPNAAADAAGGLPVSTAGGLDLDAKLANTNEVTAARMAALTDWINGGRLDLILDIIAADTTTDIPALIATLQAVADAILVDTGTTLDGRIPAALTAGGNMKADALAISGDTTAADRLEALMDGTIVAQVNDVGATTTVFIADGFTEATNDHFNGRLITFISGALSGQQTDITDYVGATQTFTVTALTEAPADNDFFVIH